MADPRLGETLAAPLLVTEKAPSVAAVEVRLPEEAPQRAHGMIIAERYRLERCIGSGGMGEVWEARHLLLDRVVAVKLLADEMRSVADRLLREARVLARVRHEAVVEVYDCGLLDGVPYLVMERLVGETLAQAVARGPMPVDGAVALFVTLLDGLQAAHKSGVIHRDLKPDNIFLARDAAGVLRPKLIDFGIAALTSDEAGASGARLTRAGLVMGTPSYMSPEQFRGQTVDARTDVWSATASLYEAIVGAPPFGDDSVIAVMQRVLEAPLPFPRRAAGVDGRLWAILTTGMRKAPGERHPSVGAMRSELVGWLAERGASAPVPVNARPNTGGTGLDVRTGESGAAGSSPAHGEAPLEHPTLDDVIRTRLGED